MKRGAQRAWLAAAAVAAIGTAASSAAYAQRDPKGHGNEAADLHWWRLRGSVWMLVGAATNVTASVGPDGVLLVDAGGAGDGPRILAAVRSLQSRLGPLGLFDTPAQRAANARAPFDTHAPPKPIRYVIDTGALARDTGGDAYLAAHAGATVLTHANVLTRLVERQADFSALPADTYAGDQYKLGSFFNGEGIRLVHAANASGDGDSIVHFRGADVIAAGDLLDMNGFPVIDVGAGGSIDGVIAGLNRILELAIPASSGEGGTLIVPAHGRVADFTDVRRYRDMLAVIRDQVQALIDKGLTRQQVVNEQPAFGYAARYGSKSGEWTTRMFIDAVYKSLEKG